MGHSVDHTVPSNASPFVQDSLFCYGDVLKDQASRDLVCTMRLLPATETEPSASMALFGDDASTEQRPVTQKARAIHRFYDVADLRNLEHVLAGATDTYISQAVFDRPTRREVNVSSIQTLFVDLDIYNIGLDPDGAISRIHALFDSVGIIDPTITTVSSGRGLYVKLPLEQAVERGDLTKWKNVERGLVNLLAPVGADAKVKDASRVLRAVGTRNGKNGATVEVLQQAREPAALDQVDQALAKAGLYKEAAGRKARAATSRRVSSAAPAADALDEDERSWSQVLSPFSLQKFHTTVAEQLARPVAGKAAMLRQKYRQFCWSALADIDRLAKMRGGRFGVGLRDTSVFWSLVLLAQAQLVTAENFWTEAFALAARTVGRYDPLGDGMLSTLFSRVCDFVGHGKDALYVATKERLMDEFRITSDEEAEMAVLRSHTEYMRRDRSSERLASSIPHLRADERRFMARVVRAVAQEKLAARNECRVPRLDVTDLAKRLRVDPRTASKYLAKLREVGIDL